MREILERAAKIRLVIFDVDGVLTDGKLFFDAEGREYKGFHVRDGHGIKLLRDAGVEVAIISGRRSESVQRRMQGLGVKHVFQGHEDKRAALVTLCTDLGLKEEEVAHVGDDLQDLPLLRRVGLAVAVADAHEALLPHVHWVTTKPGGSGAAREVCDLVLRARGALDGVIRSFH
jgi:3-deoxy-D-manno-octulosonate 8-phosphate phosphatase (KDO 8-P phosphatase)